MVNTVCIKRVYPSIKRQIGELPSKHIDRVYNLFLPLIKKVCEEVKFKGKRIDIPDYGGADKYRSFFNHLFQYKEDGTFNYDRLIDCRLVPLMILEACNDGSCKQCLTEKCSENNKKEYLFCKTYKYMIVLSQNTDSFIICTGYKPNKSQIKNIFGT